MIGFDLDSTFLYLICNAFATKLNIFRHLCHEFIKLDLFEYSTRLALPLSLIFSQCLIMLWIYLSSFNKHTGSSLKAVQVIVPIDGGVSDHQSSPNATW